MKARGKEALQQTGRERCVRGFFSAAGFSEAGFGMGRAGVSVAAAATCAKHGGAGSLTGDMAADPPAPGPSSRAQTSAAPGLSAVLAVLLLTSCFPRPAKRSALVLKVGSLSWTAEDLQKEIATSLKGQPVFPVEEELIKKKALEELVFKSLLKIWAEREALLNNPAGGAPRRPPADNLFQRLRQALLRRFRARNMAGEREKPEPIVLNKLQESLQAAAGREPLKESALRDFYKRNKKSFCRAERRFLEHILVSKENQARILHRRLLRGESFEETAERRSLAPRVIGWTERGVLNIFDKALDTVKQGAFSPPLESRYGWHIFRAGALIPPACLNFEEAKERIAKHVMEKREAALFKKWIQTELRLSPVFLNKELLNSLQISYKKRLF